MIQDALATKTDAGAGSEAATRLETLYSDHKNLVYSICRKYTRDRQDTTDLCQEVFFQALKSFGTFSEWSKFSTWIYAIAVNVAKQNLIKEYRERRLLSRYVEVRAQEQEEEPEADGERGNNPLVAKAMVLMDQKTLKILEMYSLGLGHHEIAQMFGVSRVTITKRISRLRADLRGARSCQLGSPADGLGIRRAPRFSHEKP